MTKRFLFLTAMLLMLFPGLAAAQTPEATASVAGTMWAGTDSEGSYYEYNFKPDGAMHYKSPTGFWKNGIWTQNGNNIYMQANNKYSEYRGVISGNKMKGNAWNIKGMQWKWTAEKR